MAIPEAQLRVLDQQVVAFEGVDVEVDPAVVHRNVDLE